MADRPPLSDRPLPSSFDSEKNFHNNSGFNIFLQKLKKEPLIPIGCVVTAMALTGAFRAMRRGDSKTVQRMFRARVIAQGFTVAAMVAGGIYFKDERTAEREVWKADQKKKEDDKRQKWIRELEVRDAEEKALMEKLERRKQRLEEREKTLAAAKPTEDANAAPPSDPKEGTSMFGSLGGLLSRKPMPADSEKSVEQGEKKS